MQRRTFLLGVSAGLAVGGASAHARRLVNDQVTVCVMGVRGRGNALLRTFAGLSDVTVKYVCDIDESVRMSRSQYVADRSGRRPEPIVDYRKALDDGAVDALVMGTPDHWHALPTIHACQAEKDVYVEKPDGHNILEGRAMVRAMNRHGRIVQLGTQARSGRHHQNAMRYLSQGKVGKALFAKAWESSRQGSIGRPSDTDPPPGVDYDRWLGPAPKRPFNPRRFHGSWRWFFDYGTGDLGNDGVHRLDIARWALETAVAAKGRKLPAMPRTVSAHGGKYYFDDDQEWPDTLMATYDYDGFVLTYEMRIWTPYRLHGEAEGAAVYGDQGYVVIGNQGWRAYDAKGKQIHSETASGDYTAPHARNFIDCMRSRKKPAADLETVGHPSSLLCHLGNAAWRAGKSVTFDANSYTFKDEAANHFLTRPAYRKPYVLPEV